MSQDSLHHTSPLPEPDEILDTLGLYCPVPVWEAAKQIQRMQAGQVLKVLSDDEQIVEDMPVWCRRTGNEYLGLTQHETEYHVFVRKRAG